MNKTELIDAIATASGLTKVDSKKALDGYLAAVKAELEKGGKVTLVGFGTYSVVQKKARTGINPKTKAPIKIEAKKVVKFKPGAELALN
ncbi:MAG: HU family DNA-binding protein [Dysgonamonadaceae bacterium]|jgi:DNA-binding protein HU-beta|nr:HU family DNA-binding protein [Dysgonamonadaceae bacterium]